MSVDNLRFQTCEKLVESLFDNLSRENDNTSMWYLYLDALKGVQSLRQM